MIFSFSRNKLHAQFVALALGRVKATTASEMQERILALQQENAELISLNQEQADAFMLRNKDLEHSNASLRMEVEALKRTCANLDEQVKFVY